VPVPQPLGKTYYYDVSASVGSYESPRSNEVKTTRSLAAPLLSTSTYDDPSGDGVVYAVLAISSSDPLAPSYNVYRSTTPGREGATPFITGANSYPGFLLQPRSSTYYYEVSEVAGSYESPRSSEAKVTVPALSAPVLSVPIEMSETAGLGFALAWTSPDPEAPKLLYNDYRSTTKGGEGTTPYAAGVTGNIAEPLFESFGSTYYYEISAVVGSVESARSNEVQVTAPFPGTTVQDIHEQNHKAHGKKTSVIVVSFSAALNPVDARNLAAYHLVALGKPKKSGVRPTTPVKLTKAVYDPVTSSVTLTIKGKLPNQPLRLSMSAAAVVDSHGQPLDGNDDGTPGGGFQAIFTNVGLNLTSASVAAAVRQRRR
jgi:hypothetical protein